MLRKYIRVICLIFFTLCITLLHSKAAVLTTPVADFNIGNASICVGGCTNFTDASLNAPTSWSWTFSGGTPASSTQQNPSSVCYNAPGTFTVRLIVSNGSGSDTAIKQITVNRQPDHNVIRFQKVIGKSDNEYANDIVQTADGGYVTAGYEDSSGVIDPVLVKTDSLGNTVWIKTYGGNGNNEAFNSVNLTSDNGLILNGYTDSYGSGSVDAYMVKTDGNGAVQWSRTYGGSGTDYGYYGRPTADGGFITAGSFASTVFDFYFVKSDAGGNVQWTKTVGGSGADEAYYISQTSDHGYIATGYTTSFGAGGKDVYLVKTDSNGTVQWTKTYGGGYDDEGRCVLQTRDGGYLVSGRYGLPPDNRVYLVKTNSTGDTLWTRIYTGTNGYRIVASTDGGYAIFGIYKISPINENAYLLKVDSMGFLQWNKYYGGNSVDLATCGQQTSDGGFIVGAWNSSFSTGQYDFYLVKTDSLGGSGCHERIATPVLSYGGFVSSGGTSSTNGSQTNPTVVSGNLQLISNRLCRDSVPFQTNYAVCNGSGVMIHAFGGITYSWSPSTGLDNPNFASPTASPSVNTTYTVTISNGSCSTTRTVSVSVLPVPALTITGDSAICFGGTASLTASGASSYLWSTGATTNSITVNPAVTTTYSVTGIGANGCTSTRLATVTVNTFITASILGDTVICLGQMAVLTAAGGSTYSWNTGATTRSISVSPSTATTYTVIASSGGCIDTATVQVTVAPPIVVTISNDTTICNGQTATLTVSGGTSYLWSNGATTSAITVSPSSTNSFTAIVSNGLCEDSAHALVTVNPIPTIGITSDTSICQGQNILLTASGGSSYSWSTGATTTSTSVNPSSTSAYTVIATLSGCVDTASVNIIVDLPVTAVVSNDTAICGGQNIVLTAAGGLTYSWSNGDTTNVISVSPSSSSSYIVTVTSGACSDTASVFLTVKPTPVAVVSNDTAICRSQPVTLTASGGSIYSWSSGATTTTITVTPSSTNSYTVVVSNGTCADTATITVTVDLPVTAQAGNDTTICGGHNVTLTASGGLNYLWSTGATTSSVTVNPSTSTTYIVTVSNVACFDTASVRITANPSPTAIISRDTTICIGQTAVFTVSGGNTYLWSTGSTSNRITVTPSATTTYSVVVSNGICTDTARVTATVNNIVGAAITGNTTLCAGHSTTLMAVATGGIYYYWSTTDTSQSIIVSPSVTTPYWVWVSNGTCYDTARVIVTVNPSPTVTVSNDTLIIIGQSVTLHGTGGPSYHWSPSTGLDCTTCPNPTASPMGTTTYVLTVTLSDGCSNSAEVTVNVDVKCGEVFVPSAFSPNHDGENDLLYVKNNCIKTLLFRIYDRWGEKVFETEDVKRGWDGTVHGNAINSAVFVYYLEATLFNGETVSKKGSIHLIR